ncbi:MAG: hypothetical protein JWO51_1425 [Rhodospirillales bacterium]|nr:hypothetical protein [Rhodospirillales bacterium]
MKHAGPAALARLDDLLALLRRRPALVERRPGVFYRRGRAFLHFHEDPSGLFADIRPGDRWDRWPVNDAADRARVIEAVDRTLAAASGPAD